MKALVNAAALAALLASSATALAGDQIDGRWDARLTHNGIEIPFRLDISGSGARLKGTLYDGFSAYEYTTGASYQEGQLVLNIDHYLTTITAKLDDGKLVGGVVAQNRGSRTEYGFTAVPHDAAAYARAKAVNAPSIVRGSSQSRGAMISTKSPSPSRIFLTSATPLRVAFQSRSAGTTSSSWNWTASKPNSL